MTHRLIHQPLYHGTARDFDDFDLKFFESENRGDWGRGIYFTRSRSQANRYRVDAVKNADPLMDKYYDIYQKAEREGREKDAEAASELPRPK